MRVNGRMTCSMVKEKRLGQMVRSMRGNISLERNTEWESTHGTMDRAMMASGSRTRSEA
jgi:hypothetical protein